jgi:hypothetical protein
MRQRWRRPERPRAGGCEAMAGRVGVNRRNPVLGGPFVPRRLAARPSLFFGRFTGNRDVTSPIDRLPIAPGGPRTVFPLHLPTATGGRSRLAVRLPFAATGAHRVRPLGGWGDFQRHPAGPRLPNLHRGVVTTHGIPGRAGISKFHSALGTSNAGRARRGAIGNARPESSSASASSFRWT